MAMSVGRRLAVWAINWSTLKFLELYIRNPEECIRITKIMFPFLELIVNTDKMKRGTICAISKTRHGDWRYSST